MRDLRAFVVEDPVIHHGLKSGRYPVGGRGQEDFRDLRVHSDQASQRDQSARLRHARDRALELQGWSVFEAAACLAGTGRAAS